MCRETPEPSGSGMELGFKKEATCLSNLKFMARRMYG
jgi:hypothetical protein